MTHASYRLVSRPGTAWCGSICDLLRLLVELDLCRLRHCSPRGDIGLDGVGEFLRCVADRVELRSAQSLLHVRKLHDPDDLGLELLDDRRRRACRCQKTCPADSRYPADTCFFHGRHVRERRRAYGGRNPKWTKQAIPDLRRIRRGQERHLNLAACERSSNLVHALVGVVHQVISQIMCWIRDLIRRCKLVTSFCPVDRS